MDFQQEFSKPSSSSVSKFNQHATLHSRAAILTSALVPDLMNDVIEVQCRSELSSGASLLQCELFSCAGRADLHFHPVGHLKVIGNSPFPSYRYWRLVGLVMWLQIRILVFEHTFSNCYFFWNSQRNGNVDSYERLAINHLYEIIQERCIKICGLRSSRLYSWLICGRFYPQVFK